MTINGGPTSSSPLQSNGEDKHLAGDEEEEEALEISFRLEVQHQNGGTQNVEDDDDEEEDDDDDDHRFHRHCHRAGRSVRRSHRGTGEAAGWRREEVEEAEGGR